MAGFVECLDNEEAEEGMENEEGNLDNVFNLLLLSSQNSVLKSSLLFF